MMRGSCPRGFCPEGADVLLELCMERVFCPRGFCPRGFCPRGFCPTFLQTIVSDLPFRQLVMYFIKRNDSYLQLFYVF